MKKNMFWKAGELKQMYDKYKQLQKALKNLVIRAKEGKYEFDGEMVEGAVTVDITGEMKLKNYSINDESLLSSSKKAELEDLTVKCFVKAQNKAQEIAAERTKDILGFDPSDMANMMWGGGFPGLS